MHIEPPVLFLAAALLCSLVGRILLLGPAFGVNTAWGMAVLFVPFAPMFFRLKYGELATSSRNWRRATGPLFLLFFVTGGSAASVHSLMDFGKPEAEPQSAAAIHLPVPSQVAASNFGPKTTASTSLAAPSPMATATLTPDTKQAEPPPKTVSSSTFPVTQAAPTLKATQSPAVAAASKMPAAPTILNLPERFEANRREFERLASWYDTLKHERGYLRKNDAESIEAYNSEAAKYQTALQLAKAEQAELTKLTAKK